jgi:predicted  nucleic acid-binding Zn-ribbon protein
MMAGRKDTTMHEWISPEDEAQRLRFIGGLTERNEDLEHQIDELLTLVAQMKGEQRRNKDRIRDLEEWAW